MRDADVVVDWLTERIAGMTGIEASAIAPEMAFSELGLSSVQAVELSGDLERWLAIRLPPTLAYDHPTLEATAAYVADEAQRNGNRPSLQPRPEPQRS